jgi:hypothetical protein
MKYRSDERLSPNVGWRRRGLQKTFGSQECSGLYSSFSAQNHVGSAYLPFLASQRWPAAALWRPIASRCWANFSRAHALPGL